MHPEHVKHHHRTCTKTGCLRDSVTMVLVNTFEGHKDNVLTRIVASSAGGPSVHRAWNFLLRLALRHNTLSVLSSTEEWKPVHHPFNHSFSSPSSSGALLLPFLTPAHEILRRRQPRTPLVCALIRPSVSSLEAPVVVAKVLPSACLLYYHHSYPSPLSPTPATFVHPRLPAPAL
jgi:hypothetical protein